MTAVSPSNFPDAEQGVDNQEGFRQIRHLDWDPHPLPLPPAGPPTWEVVATVKAPTDQIARFAAWHVDLGADRVTLYFDAPDPAQIEALRHPRITAHACDAAHWDKRRGRPETHQLRQARNATETWRHCNADWLAHIDVDEFLLPPAPMATLLADAPEDCAMIHLPPVEQLSGGDGRLFKRTARAAGHKSTVLADVYPTFGQYLRGGFLSHLEGKHLLRAGGKPRAEKVRFGIHGAFWQGQDISNRVHWPDLPMGHAHAPDWQSFVDHLAFRRSKGSYRNRDKTGFRLAELIDFLEESEGEAGIRQLYSEVAEATPDLIARLDAHGMLLRYPLDTDTALKRHFPDLAP